jgi:hypothetical protein
LLATIFDDAPVATDRFWPYLAQVRAGSTPNSNHHWLLPYPWVGLAAATTGKRLMATIENKKRKIVTIMGIDDGDQKMHHR